MHFLFFSQQNYLGQMSQCHMLAEMDRFFLYSSFFLYPSFFLYSSFFLLSSFFLYSSFFLFTFFLSFFRVSWKKSTSMLLLLMFPASSMLSAKNPELNFVCLKTISKEKNILKIVKKELKYTPLKCFLYFNVLFFLRKKQYEATSWKDSFFFR